MDVYQKFVQDITQAFEPALVAYKQEAGEIALNNIFVNLEESLREAGISKVTPGVLMIIMTTITPMVDILQSDLSPEEIRNSIELYFLSVLNKIIPSKL
jgi:hypothetical protein